MKYFLAIVLLGFPQLFMAQDLELKGVAEQFEARADTTSVLMAIDRAFELRNTKPDIANKLAEWALSISDSIGFVKGKGRALGYLAFHLWRKGEFDNSLKSSNKALELSFIADDDLGMSNAYNSLGLTYKQRGNYDTALIYHVKALVIREKLGNQVDIAWSYNNIGAIYEAKGNPVLALENHFKALKTREEIGDLQGLATSYNNVATSYRHLSNWPKALHYYHMALQLRQQLGDQLGIAGSNLGIGLVYFEKNEWNNAMMYAQESFRVADNHNLKYLVALSCGNVGDIYLETGKPDSALWFIEYGIKTANQIASKEGLALCRAGLAKYYNIKEEPLKAMAEAETAYKMAKEIGNLDFMHKSTKQAYIAASQLRLFEKAVDYLAMHKQLNDSLLNVANTTKALNQEANMKEEMQRLEHAKRDAEQNREIEKHSSIFQVTVIGSFSLLVALFFAYRAIRIQRKAKKEIAQKKEALQIQRDKLIELYEEVNQQKEESVSQRDALALQTLKLQEFNSTKDKFFSILAHDVKGPINSLSSFSYLLVDQIDNMDKEDIKMLGVKLNQSLKNLGALLENLLHWSRSQTGTLEYVPTYFRLYDIVSDNVQLLEPMAQRKKIALENRVPNTINVYADYPSVQTVIRNLISNAIKFTEEEGAVIVFAEATDKWAKILVKDTGVGMTAQQIEKLFSLRKNASTKGTQNETGTGLGLVLCREFVEKNGGVIWAESEKGKGSTFCFTLKNAGFMDKKV